MSAELAEIHRTLGNIEGKLDGIQDRLDGHEKLHAKLDEDVDAIQAEVNKAKGASTIIGIVAGGLGAVLALVGKFFWEDT